MFEIVLMVVLAYSNSMKAKAKEQNPILWAFITVGAFLAAMIVGGMIVIFGFCKDLVNFSQFSSTDPKAKDAAAMQLQQALMSNPLHMVTIELFAIGGYLLVRYILDRKPDKKEPEVHWMDKMGSND